MAGKTPCPKCGAENYATDRECLSCGAQLQAVPPRPAAPTTPPPPPAPTKPKREGLVPSRGEMPIYLYALALLPIGVMVVTLGGAIWGALAFGLVGANMSVARNKDMALGTRIGIMLALTVVGYAIVVPLRLASIKAGGH